MYVCMYNISRKKVTDQVDFCMQTSIKVSHKLMLLFLADKADMPKLPIITIWQYHAIF